MLYYRHCQIHLHRRHSSLKGIKLQSEDHLTLTHRYSSKWEVFTKQDTSICHKEERGEKYHQTEITDTKLAQQLLNLRRQVLRLVVRVMLLLLNYYKRLPVNMFNTSLVKKIMRKEIKRQFVAYTGAQKCLNKTYEDHINTV